MKSKESPRKRVKTNESEQESFEKNDASPTTTGSPYKADTFNKVVDESKKGSDKQKVESNKVKVESKKESDKPNKQKVESKKESDKPNKVKDESKNKEAEEAIGEVDIQLESEQGLSALDLYANAIEERDKKELTSQDVDASTHHNIVKKLFEMAIEAFEKSVTDVDTRCQFASCLYDFGMFVHVKDYVERACDEFTICLKDNSQDANLLLRRGKARIQLSKLFYNEQSDDEEDQEYALLSKVQLGLQKDGIADLKKACQIVTKDKQPEYALLCSKSLIDYAIILKRNRIYPLAILDILKAAAVFIDWLLGDQKYHITGAIYFHIASIQSHSDDETEMSKALQAARKATTSLKSVAEKSASDYQLVVYIDLVGTICYFIKFIRTRR